MTQNPKFSEIDKFLGAERDFDEGQIEGMQTKLDILSSIVSVLISMLERRDILSDDDLILLYRVKHNYFCLDNLDESDE